MSLLFWAFYGHNGNILQHARKNFGIAYGNILYRSPCEKVIPCTAHPQTCIVAFIIIIRWSTDEPTKQCGY